MKGLTSKKQPNGFLSVWLHYSADPDKQSAWAENIRAQMKDDNKYRQEYELDFSAMSGSKVFGDLFDRLTHILPEEEDYLDLRKPLLIGIDWGRYPALLLTQYDDKGRWVWKREFCGQDIDVGTFLDIAFWLLDKKVRGYAYDSVTETYTEKTNYSDKAIQYIETHRLSKWIDRAVLSAEDRSNIREQWFCDIAGNQKNDKSGDKTNIKIASGSPYNLRLRYKKSYVEPRTTLMTTMLRKRPDGEVGWLMSQQCRMAIEGISGGYVRDKYGEIEDNDYTHIFDAGGYIADSYTNISREQRKCRNLKDDKWLSNLKVTKVYKERAGEIKICN